jgi:hypothetical protein
MTSGSDRMDSAHDEDGRFLASRPQVFCVMLLSMGSKDKGRKEQKKAPKPKPKPEPSKREVFTPAPPK